MKPRAAVDDLTCLFLKVNYQCPLLKAKSLGCFPYQRAKIKDISYTTSPQNLKLSKFQVTTCTLL